MTDDLGKIEEIVAREFAGAWGAQVERFRKSLVLLYTANGGKLSVAEVRALAGRLVTAAPKVDAASLLKPAAVVGDARVAGETTVVLRSETTKILARAASKPAEAKAAMLLRAGGADLSSLSGVLAVVGPLGRSVGEMNGAASYAVHRAANEGTEAAAKETGEKLVFVAERDACLECNGASGDTSPGLTLPPLHPYCRCHVQTYTDPGVVTALKREALRSVLRGFSLPSESEAVRVRAAAAALRRQPNAPASVKRYAADAVKAGKFPRGRAVP